MTSGNGSPPILHSSCSRFPSNALTSLNGTANDGANEPGGAVLAGGPNTVKPSNEHSSEIYKVCSFGKPAIFKTALVVAVPASLVATHR